MIDLLWIAGGFVLLIVALRLRSRRKEDALLRQVELLRDSPDAVAGAMGAATADERKRAEAWHRQNPRGSL